jgi:hypothetical protein
MRYTALLAVLLTGCVATNWTHPSKTEAQFKADAYDCQQIATQYAANLGYHGNPLIVRDAYHECMVGKYGYIPVKGDPKSS